MPPETDPSSGSNPDPSATAQPDVNQIVNQAITAHLRRFAEKQLPSMLEAALKPIQEKLTAAPAQAPQAPSGGEEELRGKAKANAELEKLAKQVEEMRALAEKAEKSRMETEKRAREERAYSDLRTELGKNVKPEFVDMLAHWLMNGEKVVRLGEDGNPYVHLPARNTFGEVEETPFPLADGIASWAKSDKAKAYIPAPQPNMGGQKPSGAGHQYNGGRVDASKVAGDDAKLAVVAQILGKK